MNEITKNVLIRAPIERVWAALTDPAAISAWMDGEVQSDLRPGGKYTYFDGETSGIFTRVEIPIRLEYTWRQSNWPREWADSNVRWHLRLAGDDTQVQLVHDHLPNEDERLGHDEGWDMYWLQPMKTWLEQ